MIDLSKCALEQLRADATFILFRAHQPGGGRSLLALVPRQPTIASLEKLENEYALAADLDRAWAVLPIELVPHKETMMLVLDDPGGTPLTRMIEEPLALDDQLRLAVGLAKGVGGLHRHGLLHRDIRPGNILVIEPNNVRLMGFGKTIHQTQQGFLGDLTGEALPYIAPEQTGRTNRPNDSRSDLYAVGVLLYEIFTGTLPFAASTAEEWIHCHIARTPPPLNERKPHLPNQISAIVLKLLSKEPGDRYQSAEGLAADLGECLATWTARRRVYRFALGRSDAATALRIPQALYGRSAEIEALRSAFNRVTENGQTVVALVSGPSGVGKSSVVTEFHSCLAPTEALIGTGKFDMQVRDVPYTALTQAFGSLLRQVLTYDDDDVAAWRRALAEAIGPNGYLVSELIPELDIVLGQPSALPDVVPHERYTRLRTVFRSLAKVFARPGRPFVLFIDDLQWLDVATLEIVVDLVVRRDVPNMLLIGAYRSDGVNSNHALISQLSTIRAAGVPIEEIALQPLTKSDIASLFAKTLACRRARAQPLANLVHAKTGGNPFFVTQLLRMLFDEGLLSYDSHAGAWRWEIARVRALGFTDSVADLMTAKLALLSGSTRRILQILAFLGSVAELEGLAIASGWSAQEVAASLGNALRAGLVVRKDESYAFVHDRVQEAAYALQPAEDKPALHLRIGMALAGAADLHDETSERLYLVANQLNLGITAVTSEAQRARIVAVNLAAGRRARNAAAYNAAIVYLEVARKLLGHGSHPRHGATSFAVALQRAECELLIGRLDVADELLLELWQHCPNVQASAEVTRLRAGLYTIRGQLAQGIDVCLAFLRRVGIDWRAHPTDREVDNESYHVRRLAKDLSDEQLHALPPMTDPIYRATMTVFTDLIPPSNVTDRNLSHIVVLAAVRLTLEHGVCAESSYPLVQVFDALGIRYTDAELGFRLARFGAAIADRHPQLWSSGRALTVFGHLVAPWVQPIRTGLAFVQRGLKIAQATGDLTYVAFTRRALVSVRLFCGDPLGEICEDAERALESGETAGFEVAADAFAVQRTFALGLIRQEKDSGSEEPDLTAPHPLEGPWPQIAFFDCVARIQANQLAGRHDAALALADRAEKLSWVARRHPEWVEYRFYVALAHAAAYDASEPENGKMHANGLRHQHRELTTRCTGNSTNFSDRLTLLAAEIARIEGRELEAEQLYEKAIGLAREARFVQIEAIAAERAARFYGTRGIRTVVLSYLANARDCYLRWGAHAKVRQLEGSNPHLLASDPIGASYDASDVVLRQLEVGALFKASRALSGEIVLDALIHALMKVVVEHAAAERGILFLTVNDSPLAVAEARLAASGIEVTVQEDGLSDVEFSKSVLNYVVRTLKSFSSGDAANNTLSSADPFYWQHMGHVSLNCLPIVAQTKLVGVLYLESPGTVGAFTPQRAAVLDLLAAQAAISLENARLYTDLKRSEAFLAEGQRMSHSGSWSWNAQSGKLLWSHEHYRIFGLDPKIGNAPTVRAALRMVHAEDRNGFRRTVQSSVRDSTAFTYEYRIVRPDGVRHLLVVARPETDVEGHVKSFVGTTIDVTDYKRTQEALQAAQSDLARASRLAVIGELTSLIAHDVRQPLTAIAADAGACQSWLTRAHPNIGEATAAAARITRAAHSASGVIQSIRNLTRKSNSTFVPVDINNAIAETVTLLSSEIRRQRIVLDVDLAANLNPVLADRVQLQQVVMNLVMNGIEAMATIDDRPRLLSLSTAAEPSGNVVAKVADVGIGLPVESVERVFEAFFTTKPTGLGVGLAISRSIVESHGGALWASPNYPTGSIFRFSLPAAIELRD